MKEGWEVKKLGDLAKTSAGGTPLKSKKEYYEGGNIPWLLSGEVAQTEIHTSVKYITEAGLQNSSAKLFPPEAVLVAMYGATAGQVGVLKFEASTNQAVCGIFPQQKLVTKYTYFFFLHYKAELLKQAVGNAQPNISQAKIKNTQIPVPPLAEQEAIVEILDKAFAAIDQAKANLEQNITNAKELFQSKLNQIFSQKGEGWVEKTLISVTNFIDYRGRTPKKTESGIRLITAKNVRMGYLKRMPEEFIAENAFDDWMTRGIPNEGDVLFTTEAPLANVALLNTNEKIALAQRIITICPDRDILTGEYLSYCLQSKVSQDRILEKGTGATVTGIKSKLLKEIPISIAPKSRQNDIVEELDFLSDSTKQLESYYQTKLASLDELKKSILQKAFAGELT